MINNHITNPRLYKLCCKKSSKAKNKNELLLENYKHVYKMKLMYWKNKERSLKRY